MRESVLSFGCLAAPLALALLSSLAQPAQAAQIEVGQTAPALTFTTLLQAPPDTRADWRSLHGKVVVLEFWATWCGGCIVEIPHLNDLEKSLATTPEGAKIQFIAVDDEDLAVVKKFVAKMPIGGWLGIDTSKKIIAAYGAKSRPLTVVVDPKGRIAAIFSPQQLKADQLQALADGKPVTFPADETAGIREEALKQAQAAESAENGTGGVKPIFDLAIRPGDPNGRIAMTHTSGSNDSSDTIDVLNAKVSMLLQMGADVDAARLTVKNEPAAVYDLHLRAPRNDDVDLDPVIEQAIAAAAGMKIRHVTAEEDVWILTAAPQAVKLLQSNPSGNASGCSWRPSGKMVMMNSSLNCLTQSVEAILKIPVIDETGLTGNYDASFDLPIGTPESVGAILTEKLGLTLVKGRRSIERVLVEPLTPGPTPATSPSSPASSPTQPATTAQKP
jgi:uncharacterized protein (TIGR03435 family)